MRLFTPPPEWVYASACSSDMSCGSAANTASENTSQKNRALAVRVLRRTQVANVSSSQRSARSAAHGASSGHTLREPVESKLRLTEIDERGLRERRDLAGVPLDPAVEVEHVLAGVVRGEGLEAELGDELVDRSCEGPIHSPPISTTSPPGSW